MMLLACHAAPTIAERHTASVAEAFPWAEGAASLSPSGGVVQWDAQLVPTRLILDEGAAHIGVVESTLVVVMQSGETLIFDTSGVARRGHPVPDAFWVGALDGRANAASVQFEPAVRGGHVAVSTTAVLEGTTVVTRLYIRNAAMLFPEPNPGSAYGEGDRLYLGWDGGEWGGAFARISPRQQTAELLSSGSPVYGTAHLRDGVYAVGGQTHLGDDMGYVDGPHPYTRGRGDPGEGPIEPITHALERQDGSVVVLTETGAIWETDASFEAWSPSTREPGPFTAAWIDDSGDLVTGTRSRGLRRDRPSIACEGNPLPLPRVRD